MESLIYKNYAPIIKNLESSYVKNKLYEKKNNSFESHVVILKSMEWTIK